MNDQVNPQGQATQQPPAQAQKEKTAAEKYPHLIGAFGWLKFLCIWLVVLVPGANFISFMMSCDANASAFNSVDGLEVFCYISYAVTAIGVLLFINAGRRLWDMDIGAVKTAKIAFNVWLFSFAGLVILGFAIIEDVSGKEEFLYPMAANLIVQMVVYWGGWYQYLKRSKRVKATFPDQA